MALSLSRHEWKSDQASNPVTNSPGVAGCGQQLGTGLVFRGGALGPHAHGDQGHEGRVHLGHVADDRRGADEAAEQDRIGAGRGHHSLGAGARALDQAAAREIGASDRGRRIAEVETVDAAAVHLAHDEGVGPAFTEREGVIDSAHQHHFSGAAMKRPGRRAEGAEDVNDDCEPASSLGAVE